MTKASKKGGAIALQTEVTNEEEWKEILERKGLVLVDVYSERFGPCAAMVSTLRKLKMEIGGDVLSYAIARSDDVASLERFRGRSEPAWMFLQDGLMVNLLFGAHCPRLRRAVLDELRRLERDEPPNWNCPVGQRSPEEESRWQQEEAARIAKEEERVEREEAEKRAKYENFMEQRMFELCEETALVLYPWVFLDDQGYPREKGNCPAYTELTRDILPEGFDILEQCRIQLDQGIIEKMLVESNEEITDDLLEGLTRDKCMAIRLRARAPSPEWPVVYPYECPEGVKRCPSRAIDDAENYLKSLLVVSPQTERGSLLANYLERHVYVREPETEDEDDDPKTYPAIWIPPQARSKVHVFETLFGSYMEKTYPYEEPVQPPPLCACKFDAAKFPVVQAAYRSFASTIVKFGAFEFDDPTVARRLASSPDDYELKVKKKKKIGCEIFVIVLRRTNDEAFLAFAGNEPYFVTEDNDEAERIVEEYFPPEALDWGILDDSDEESYSSEYYEEDEGGEDYEDVF